MGKAVHAACCCISAFSAHVESELRSRCSAFFLLFRPCLVPKIFQDSPSHRILRHLHEALNIDENKN